MTPQEEAVMRLVIEKATRDSMDMGLLAAVQMIRIAAATKPGMTFEQLANAIESTVTKDQ